MRPLYLAVIAVGFLSVIPATAQPVISAKSGLLSYVEGVVLLNDQPVEFSTTHFADVKENSIVKTEDGRAEVLLTPGVTLRMGENSSLRMIANRLVDTRVELMSGSAVIEADQIAKDTNVTIIDGQGSVTLPKAGLYRFDASPAQVKVFKGDVEVEIGGQTRLVSTAHMLSLATETASIERFDLEDTDALDRWSHRRGSYMAMANTSAARSLVSSGSVPSGWGMGGSGWGLGGLGLGMGTGYGLCSSAWGYNAYYGMMTFIPCTGSLWSPYGYQFWSPYAISRYSWVNPPLIYGGGASRTGTSPSGSASLARPAASAAYRSTSSVSGMGSSHSGIGTATNSGNGNGSSATPSFRSSGASLSESGGGGGLSGGGGRVSGGSAGHAAGGHK